MTLWFVTAAHGRYQTTLLALTQRALLHGALAARGIETRTVVVACDDNLSIAQAEGFDTIEMSNDQLGARVNAGLRYAAERDADWFCWSGSDDWMHESLFTPLAAHDPGRPVVLAGRNITIVDLQQPRLRRLHVTSNVGAPPWIISREALRPAGFEPIRPEKNRGLDGSLVLGMGPGRPDWIFDDPVRHARVDFKDPGSITPYDRLARLGHGPEITKPWRSLADTYGPELAQLALDTHRKVAA